MSASRQLPKLGVSACVWREGQVLLVQRSQPPLHGVWSLPGGHVEPGEQLVIAARRELSEETGVEAGLEHLAGLYEIIRNGSDGLVAVHYVIACYTGHWISGEAVAASDALLVSWADPDKLAGLTFAPNVKDAIAAARAKLRI
jgi:ADP-ribose pyrophosphatase YjhB (NUDIX family)